MPTLIPHVPIIGQLAEPLANVLGLKALPLNLHEIIIGFIFYEFVFLLAAPWISKCLVGAKYKALSAKDKLRWDAQCVSLVQSIVISGLAFWVIAYDAERKEMKTAHQRLWGYSAASGSVQAFATGYFLWDLITATTNFQNFGMLTLVHAVCCFSVYLLGFRPIFNFYCCTFVLFELSTPFLNVHLFLKQLGSGRTSFQVANGVILTAVFFLTRLVYGAYWSVIWFSDIWEVYQATPASEFPGLVMTIFVLSNVALNTLNVVWFGKMIKAVTKSEETLPRKRGH